MVRHRSTLFLLAALACAAACSSTTSTDVLPDGAVVGTGGAPGTGGSAGGTATGGAAGAAGAPDTSFCFGDAGRLASAAKACAADGDCAIGVAQQCCGADLAYGVAKAEQSKYAVCYALPPNACSGLGCAKFMGYRTDTNEETTWNGAGGNALDQVVVHCASAACTTDVVVLDAGRD